MQHAARNPEMCLMHGEKIAADSNRKLGRLKNRPPGFVEER